MQKIKIIEQILKRIYGADKGRRAYSRILPLIEAFPAGSVEKSAFFSEKDIYLITYGDTLYRESEAPLKTLSTFAEAYLSDISPTVHFLPFFPFSSDDGFSVTDFFAINPDLGDWNDIARFKTSFDLMFDFVINHFSAESNWFKSYLESSPGYESFAIAVDPKTDLSAVTRPRALPLLTPFTKKNGDLVHVWTTFSADQIDFNYRSLDVLEKMIEALLFYVLKGARTLRLDAIAYLWKDIGTNCIHRPETHDMVKLFRAVLDCVAPDVIIITETNVPHTENISYFGNGRDEAQMVYNFTLPPLLLHAFIKEDTTALSAWAKDLRLPSRENTFFNFTASHDGIGVRPLEGILPATEIDGIIKTVRQAGGDVSYKQNPDGSRSPYELNITYIDAILGSAKNENPRKFMASQSIQYALPGVPATYIHSLLGSRNWNAGVALTGRARTINREKLHIDQVMNAISDTNTFRARVFTAYLQMMKKRQAQPAFHPNADFEILQLDPAVFAIKRTGKNQSLLAVTNISSHTAAVSLPSDIPTPALDLLSEKAVETRPLELEPYAYVWLLLQP